MAGTGATLCPGWGAWRQGRASLSWGSLSPGLGRGGECCPHTGGSASSVQSLVSAELDWVG